LENISFRRISSYENRQLLSSFFEGKTKTRMWGCDNVNSSSPNSVSFGFVKEFWDDIMRHMFESHING